MGEIFLARQAIAGVDRLVVLKRLLPGLSENAELVAMFVDEARIAANLAHPGIVQVHEFGEDTQGCFIVMEYVAGHHVGQVISRALRERTQIAIRIGAFIVYEVARALDHAHHACDSDGSPLEIVHRDISPSNVLVSFRGDVKLMDFGIARAANRAHRTSDGSIRGKFAYMAPEQIESRHIDARSDVFAAGILLWELTLGRRLFTGPSDLETIRAVLEQPIPRPTSIDPAYPPALEAVAMAALERDHGRRLASAAQLAADLKTYLRANPTDRDDVAALMTELFPGDAAASERLDERAPARPGDVPTVIVPAGPEADAPVETEAADLIVEQAPPPRRSWRQLAGVLLVAGGGVLAWSRTCTTCTTRTTRATSAPAPAGSLAPVRADAPAIDAMTPPGDASPSPADAEPRPIGAVAAPVVVRPPRRDVRTARPPPARVEPSVDAGVELDAAVVELGVLSLAGPAGVSIRVDGPQACQLHSVPMRCHLPIGQAYEFSFRVSGRAAFTAVLRPGRVLRRYTVDPTRETVDCIDGC